MRYLIVVVGVFFTLSSSFLNTYAHSSDGGAKPQIVKEIWKRYGQSDFIFDTNHILEEMANIMELHESKQIKPSEAVFYYHRLHDFNSDGHLDGLELLQAARHSMMHEKSGQSMDFDELVRIVDAQLDGFDKNKDGLVDYNELMQEVVDDVR